MLMDSSKLAVYPGSFDPVTNGHLDILERALKIFDRIIVMIGDNPNKNPFFSPSERIDMLNEAIKKQIKVKGVVEVEYFGGVLLNFLKKKNANIIVRGLRAVSDFEFEFQRALLNRKLDSTIETVFIMTKDEYSFLNSSIVKEISRFNGSVKGLVPINVEKELKNKLNGIK